MGIAARMLLINIIADGKPERSIVSGLVLVAALLFAEYAVRILIQADEIGIKRKYKFSAVEAVADKCASLPLTVIEQKTTQDIVFKSRKYYQKSQESIRAVCRILDCILTFAALIFALSHAHIAIILAFAAALGLAFFACFRSSKQTFGFWSKYMANARRYNYFSDVQTKREYAYERRSYDFSDAMDARFSDAFDVARSLNRKNGLIRFYGQVAVEGISICISIFTLFYFANPSSLFGFTVGAYAAITELVTRLLATVSTCPDSIFTIREFSDLKNEISSFLSKGSGQKEEQGRTIYDGDISKDTCAVLNDVCFSYPSAETEVLSGLSFTFKKGVHYGLVGENGSGKSTLAKLLLGLYEPAKGKIRFGNSGITAIFQDFQVYPITVREYLRMGNMSDLSDGEMLSMLKRLGCEGLKDGLDTPITLLTDEGTLLSKGQFQRLAIARVCLSDADLIILDEPTASLDPISEKQIYETSMAILKGRTCLFISHRLGAVRGMDEILVMENGRLCETGTHDSLMAKGGVYSTLYTTQRGMYIDAEE